MALQSRNAWSLYQPGSTRKHWHEVTGDTLKLVAHCNPGHDTAALGQFVEIYKNIEDSELIMD